MDKISAIGVNTQQQLMLKQMSQTAMQAGASSLDMPVLAADAGFATQGTQNTSFGNVLNQALDNVNALQNSASAKQQAIDMGQSDDLAGAMIESQKASVSFSALMQVRNKLNSALDEVMNTPL
jgi:flagellar hook-basal body complex protein FliE